MEKSRLLMVIANPPGFSIPTLMQARDALFEPNDDSELGRANQVHRDMLTREINSRP